MIETQDNSGTHGHVPRTVRRGPITVSLVVHRSGLSLGAHAHDDATLTVALGGDYRESVGRGLDLLRPMQLAMKPPGTIHSNHVGPEGARSLLFSICAEWLPRLPAAASVLSSPQVADAGAVAGIAMRLVRELRQPDGFTDLTVDSLVAEWFALLAREAGGEEVGASPPRWLIRLRDQVHATPVARLRLDDLADSAGRHASLVARTFRRQYGMSIGEYARRLRVARAARRLGLCRNESLSRIALDAGYCDHSHMTHDFRSRTGVAPADWRAIAAGR